MVSPITEVLSSDTADRSGCYGSENADYLPGYTEYCSIGGSVSGDSAGLCFSIDLDRRVASGR